MYIIKHDNQWDFRCTSLPVNLIGQIGQVKLEILEIKENSNEELQQGSSFQGSRPNI